MLIFVTRPLVMLRVILKFIRPEPNQVFNVDSSEGFKYLTRIRIGLSHLTYYKYRRNFWNEKLKAAQNRSILTSAIKFLQATERFKTSLFNEVPNYL